MGSLCSAVSGLCNALVRRSAVHRLGAANGGIAKRSFNWRNLEQVRAKERSALFDRRLYRERVFVLRQRIQIANKMCIKELLKTLA